MLVEVMCYQHVLGVLQTREASGTSKPRRVLRVFSSACFEELGKPFLGFGQVANLPLKELKRLT